LIASLTLVCTAASGHPVIALVACAIEALIAFRVIQTVIGQGSHRRDLAGYPRGDRRHRLVAVDRQNLRSPIDRESRSSG